MILINGVTGAIGSEYVKLATSQGIKVAGIGRNPSKIAELATAYKQGYFLEVSDIGSEQEADTLVKKIENHFGEGISQYLHTAAILTRSNSPLETTLSDFRETLEINLVGAFVWNKTVISSMISHSISGSIVNVASQAARTGGFGGTTSYASPKGGLVTLSKTFARYAAKHNIRVNSISPGFVDNEMMTNGLTEQQVSFFSEKTSLKRLATNYEIANVCKFLLSDESSYILGENVEVSAGQVLG